MEHRIQDFLNFLELEKKYAENTIVAYQNDVNQFLQHVLSKEVIEPHEGWSKVDEEILKQYVNSLKESNYSSSTVARKVAAIKTFCHYLVAEDVLPTDPTKELDSPKVKKRLPKALSPHEIDRLLQAPLDNDGNTPKAQRDVALLEMLYASGMRVTELVLLNTQDLDIKAKPGAVRVKGKKRNAQERRIPIAGPTLEALREYVENGRQQLVQDTKVDALFVNNRGRRLTRQGLWLIIKHYVKTVGIATHVTPHTLRHSFAAHKLSQGKSLQDIQRLLGHANISTTQVYAQVKKEKQRNNIREMHPDQQK